VNLGFQVTHSNGAVIYPDGYQESVTSGQSTSIPESVTVGDCTVNSSELIVSGNDGNMGQLNTSLLLVSLAHAIRIGPQQSAAAAVQVQADQKKVQALTVIVVPKNDTLATMNCDLMEGIWMGKQSLRFQS